MPTAHAYESIDVTHADDVTTITLDRPEKKNAINPTMIRELNEAIYRAKIDARDPDGGSNVLVVTGSGDSFSAGMDLEEYFLANKDDPALMDELVRSAMELQEELYRFPRATIGAVNGWCFGGAMGLLGCCDLAIASEEATFGLSEVRWGIMPAGGATRMPAWTISRRDFLELSLTGREIDAEYADKIRLVNRTVPADELKAEVDAFAAEISELNPRAIEYAKLAYQHEIENNMSYDAAVTYEIARNRHLRQVTDQEDVKALRAFSEKKFKPGIETYTQEDIEAYEDE